MSGLQGLVKRYEGNPILTASDLPGCEAVFNCGAVKFGKKYLLLVSVSKPAGAGAGRAVHVAESKDGIHFTINPKPFISPEDTHPRACWNYDLCDPRVTLLEGTYYITYPAHSPGQGVIGILGKTKDFKKFEYIEVIGLPSNRVPILFPEKIGGTYWRLDRPFGVYPGSLWLSRSPDLIHWGQHRSLLSAGVKVWNNVKVGPAGPPIKTKAGWLLIYHTVSGGNIATIQYFLSCALLDLKDPTKIIGMPDDYLLGAEAPYERSGKVNNVVFSCGHIVEPDGELKLYYGAADTYMCLATGSLRRIITACQNGE